MTRDLTDEQKQARRDRAKRRRKLRKGEVKPKKKKAKRKLKPTSSARLKRLIATSVVWREEMKTTPSGIRYGTMWVKGHRIGKEGGRWVSDDVAQDIANAIKVPYKEVS